jgi:hypothetical protein
MILAVFALGLVTGKAANSQTGGAVTVTGTVTDEGVQCRALRGDDGVLYTIRHTDAVRALRAGDRVRIEGRTAVVSNCQQGITIEPTRLEKAD